MRRHIESGSTFETDIGYARAVVDGEWIFVSGTTGFDYTTMTISPDVRDQAEQAMRNIAGALAQAGGDIADPVTNPKFAHKLSFLDEMKACAPLRVN